MKSDKEFQHLVRRRQEHHRHDLIEELMDRELEREMDEAEKWDDASEEQRRHGVEGV